MNVGQIMSSRLVTVELDDKLEVVKEIFDTMQFHHVLVIEDGKLFGVVSDRDLLKAISPFIGSATETYRDLATLNKRVHQVMSRKPITLHPEADLSAAVALFLGQRISCIPIVDDDFRPIGLVSWRDVLRCQLGQPSAAP